MSSIFVLVFRIEYKKSQKSYLFIHYSKAMKMTRIRLVFPNRMLNKPDSHIKGQNYKKILIDQIWTSLTNGQTIPKRYQDTNLYQNGQ